MNYELYIISLLGLLGFGLFSEMPYCNFKCQELHAREIINYEKVLTGKFFLRPL